MVRPAAQVYFPYLEAPVCDSFWERICDPRDVLCCDHERETLHVFAAVLQFSMYYLEVLLHVLVFYQRRRPTAVPKVRYLNLGIVWH